jgi:hypothetical protein
MDEHERQNQAGNEGGDKGKDNVLQFLAGRDSGHGRPGFAEDDTVPENSKHPLSNRRNQNQNQEVMNIEIVHP